MKDLIQSEIVDLVHEVDRLMLMAHLCEREQRFNAAKQWQLLAHKRQIEMKSLEQEIQA